jgi:hypothetical protein
MVKHFGSQLRPASKAQKQSVFIRPFDRDENFVGRRVIHETLTSSLSIRERYSRVMLYGAAGVG